MRIIITGGHHSSALPVIEELKNRFSNVQMFWLGHKYSMKGDKNPTLEYREITELGIPFFHLHAGKLYKTFDPIRLSKIPFGFFQSLFLLLKLKPDIVLSFGGYLAVPVVFVARILGIPSLTHEQTTVAGYANKFISYFVDKILISWPNSAQHYPKEKVIYTGLPLRKEIFSISSNSFIINSDLPVVYITAGKTGSHKINTLIQEILVLLLHYCNIIHQCGNNSVYNDYEGLNNEYKRLQDLPNKIKGQYFVRKFIRRNEIGEVFAKSNLVISRSGAHITMELLALEKPAILIPIPWVSHNEQYENAKLLEKAGLALMIEEKNLTSNLLDQSIKEALQNLSNMTLKDKGYKNAIIKNSAEIIVNEVAQLYRKTN